jgi:hypothetical protein
VRLGSSVRAGSAVFFALLAISCGGDDDTTSPPPEDPLFPADYLTTYTEVRNLRLSNNHDGSNPDVESIRVHASPEGASAYTNGIYPLPEGTVLVKTQYADAFGSVITGYTVMKKGPAGTAPASRDWIWQEIDRDRVVIQNAGQIQTCIECHDTNTDCTEEFTCTLP